jgi:hypothetical protein
MIQNASFQRKVLYLGLIVLLLMPLYFIGHPATGDPRIDTASKPGGQLAQLRNAHGLSPTSLGEIDPASESMKLATLGMKGPAASFLWMKEVHYKKTEDWEKLVATVNTMTKLQPNFVSVWEFQSHNLSYNISAEHDDYRFRYLWVKKGIEFLIRGTHYNRSEPKMFWTVGWYTGQKFGIADERKQFRRLFPEDEDFHDIIATHIRVSDFQGDSQGPDGLPDNWLTSRLWYREAYNIVDTEDRPLRGKAPHIYFADGPKALINHATAIGTEGVLDERLEIAWRTSSTAWDRYGDRQFTTSWGVPIQLNAKEAADQEAKRLAKELIELVPGASDEIEQEKIDQLSARDRELLEKDWRTLTSPTEMQTKMQAHMKTTVALREIAERAPADKKAIAIRLAKLSLDKETEAKRISGYRDNVNFEYWRARCRVEQMSETVEARRLVYQAREAAKKAEFVEAQFLFESAWDKWAGILEKQPHLVDRLTEDDLYEDIQAYVGLLGQLDEELPEDFALQAILEKFRMKYMIPEAPGTPPAFRQPGTPPSMPPGAGKPNNTNTNEPAASESEESNSEPAENKDAAAADPPESGDNEN